MAKYVLHPDVKYCKRTLTSTVNCDTDPPSWNDATAEDEFLPCEGCDPNDEQDWTADTTDPDNCFATKIECIGPCEPDCCPDFVGPETPDISVPEECCADECVWVFESVWCCDAGTDGAWGEVTLKEKLCEACPSESELDSWDYASNNGYTTCDDVCTAIYKKCVEFNCELDSDCPDPLTADFPDCPALAGPEFEIRTNGRINGCELGPNEAGTVDCNGTIKDACPIPGGKNNPACQCDSHFRAAIYSNICTVSVCELDKVSLTTVACESGPSCSPADCGAPPGGGACSWPCDPDGFGDGIRIYAAVPGVGNWFAGTQEVCDSFRIGGGGGPTFFSAYDCGNSGCTECT